MLSNNEMTAAKARYPEVVEKIFYKYGIFSPIIQDDLI